MAEQQIDPGLALVAMARSYIHEHPTAKLSIVAALEAVRLVPEGAALFRQWSGVRPAPAPQVRQHSARETVSEELDGKARDHMRARGEKSYVKAVEAVLIGDADLRRRYAESR